MNSDSSPPGAVVVGLDGSATSDHALDWAALEAALEHRPLVLVHAAPILGSDVEPWLHATYVNRDHVLEEVRVTGHGILRNAEARARDHHPDLDVLRLLRTDDPRTALAELSARAHLVVVGSRGRGRVSSLLLGSVSASMSRLASCPLVVVRPELGGRPRTREGVLVGTDGSARGRPALEVAFELAAYRGLGVRVVRCFWDATDLVDGVGDVPDGEPGTEDLRAELALALAPLAEKHPQVPLDLRLYRGYADLRLVRGSRDMDLVVVGAHGRGPLRALSGSSASTVTEHADCPVVVVPDADSV